jgi:hypothetical protein
VPKFFKTYALASMLFITQSAFSQNGGYTGMANASVSLYDFWSVFNNQAGLADIDSPEIGVCYDHNYQMWQTGVQSAGFVLPTKTGNFALMSSRYGYSGYSEQETGLAYARNLGKMFSASVGFNYLFYSQKETTGHGGALIFQVGIISKPVKNLQIGLNIYNPGRAALADFNNKQVPTIFQFGMAYYFSPEVLFSVESEKDIEQANRFKAGLQYQIINDFYLRTGFMTNPNQFSLGIGYNMNGFTTDIAITTHEVLQLSSQISFKYKF